LLSGGMMIIFTVKEKKNEYFREEINMVEIELTQNEANILREVLQTHLSEISFEIAFTHNKEFTDLLRKKRDFMIDFLERLERVPFGEHQSPENEFFAKS
jgi:hypothetical protein